MLTVITGAPCAGKSTYARQHRRPGDIVIDFDDLAQALGSGVTHDHADHIREVAAAAWSSAVREAIRQHRAGRRVWIVDTRPSAHRREDYDRAGARMVVLTVGAAELHRRADADRSPSAHRRIDEYLAKDAARDPAPASRTRW